MAAVSEPGGDAGRVRCLYCGANNFPSSASCWQCHRPLKAMPSAPADAPASAGAASAAAVGAAPALPPGYGQPAARLRAAESALAPKAAAALGMLFPFVALPAGMIFLMLDDPRKTQLGWLMIGWSVGGSVISTLLLAATLGPLWAVLKALMPHPGGGAAPAIPGLPSDGGGLGLLLRLTFS